MACRVTPYSATLATDPKQVATVAPARTGRECLSDKASDDAVHE